MSLYLINLNLTDILKDLKSGCHTTKFATNQDRKVTNMETLNVDGGDITIDAHNNLVSIDNI